MTPIQFCRHYEVRWIDSHTCHCKNCGRQGRWVDGLVIWSKKVRVAKNENGASRHPRRREKVPA